MNNIKLAVKRLLKHAFVYAMCVALIGCENTESAVEPTSTATLLWSKTLSGQSFDVSANGAMIAVYRNTVGNNEIEFLNSEDASNYRKHIANVQRISLNATGELIACSNGKGLAIKRVEDWRNVQFFEKEYDEVASCWSTSENKFYTLNSIASLESAKLEVHDASTYAVEETITFDPIEYYLLLDNIKEVGNTGKLVLNDDVVINPKAKHMQFLPIQKPSCVLADGKTWVSIYENMRFFDVNQIVQNSLKSPTFEDYSSGTKYPTSCWASQTGARLAVEVGEDVYIYNTSNGSLLAIIRVPSSAFKSEIDVKFSPLDHTILYILYKGRTLYKYKVE